MKSAEAIKYILGEQVKSYKMLIALLQRERTSLIDLRAADVEELSKEKDTLVLQLRLLEEERVRLMGDFSDGTTLKNLAELTGDIGISDLRSTLISLVQSVEELNEFNRVLIERSMTYIRNTANFFGVFGLSSGGSSRTGSIFSVET